MSTRSCPYCKKAFAPSRYRPDQTVCSGQDCQRKRRAEYHRKKLLDDPIYRAQCRDSQKKWRDTHPGYTRNHRRAQGHTSQGQVERLARLLEDVKNNVALDLKGCNAEVWLVCGSDVKNILASAHLILFKADPSSRLGRKAREHPLGEFPARDI
jgi:hypothetical protein